jgi:hypothetical protein
MARRLRSHSTPEENLQRAMRAIPWKLLVLLPLFILIAVPSYLFGVRISHRLFSSLTSFAYTLSAPPNSSPTPTPLPAFPTVLPQVGSVLYTVQNGDSCDSILASQMHMADAGTIFSDANPPSIKALNAVVGQNCDDLQPGMVLSLMPQYPLMVLGGIVRAINSSTPQQVIPTPLINVPTQTLAPDCSGGCWLTVSIAPSVQIHLLVQTTLAIHVGSWVWAQAAMQRKSVPNFSNYPYVDPTAPLNGTSLRACDLQIDNTHDGNSLSCDQLTPNTIDDDGGAWLFGVVNPSSLGHWGYHLSLPKNTQVLLWLTQTSNGSLVYKAGNPLYRYDQATHVYVKA